MRDARFEVCTYVMTSVKFRVFCDVTPYSLVDIYRSC